MLTCARFGNDAMLAHPAREQRLPRGIVDLVRAGVQKIFPFEWLASCDRRFLHCGFLRRGGGYWTLGHSDGSDEIFNGAIIFRAWCPFDAAANVNRVWRDSRYGMANILRV